MEAKEPWEQTVERFYKEMYPALHVYALRILGDAALAEEAIQDAFCIVCARRERLLASDNPKSWIMCTLKHVMQNMLRTQAKLKKLVSLSPELEETLPAGEPELVGIDTLYSDVSDSEDFQLLKRIALERCSMREIAQNSGISEETCKKRVQRARKRLQKKIEA